MVDFYRWFSINRFAVSILPPTLCGRASPQSAAEPHPPAIVGDLHMFFSIVRRWTSLNAQISFGTSFGFQNLPTKKLVYIKIREGRKSRKPRKN
jgi:hypothetical protein